MSVEKPEMSSEKINMGEFPTSKRAPRWQKVYSSILNTIKYTL